MTKNAAGKTPLMHALEQGTENIENIKTIIRCSKPEEINAADNEGRTVLHHLAKMRTKDKGFLKVLTRVRMLNVKYKYIHTNSVCSSCFIMVQTIPFLTMVAVTPGMLLLKTHL